MGSSLGCAFLRRPFLQRAAPGEGNYAWLRLALGGAGQASIYAAHELRAHGYMLMVTLQGSENQIVLAGWAGREDISGHSHSKPVLLYLLGLRSHRSQLKAWR